MQAEFDIIHSHIGVWALALASMVSTPTVHTLHGTLYSLTTLKYLDQHTDTQPYISISDSQRLVKHQLRCHCL